MNYYKLAIIIPSWNCNEYIGEMLESIIANSFVNWKCFVVDDQSTDNSIDVIKNFQERDSRIISVIRERGPKGAQTCRNIGFEFSEGAEYVIWFDADDVVAPYCFEQRIEYMDRHPELDFGVFPAKTYKDQLWEVNDSTMVYGFRFGTDSLQDMLKWCLPMVGWTNIYRRSSVVKYNLSWDTKLKSMQDSDFNISAMLKGLNYNFAADENAQVDYFYRVGQTSGATVASKIQSVEHMESHLYLLNKILSSLSSKQLTQYRRDIECYLFRFADIFRHNKPIYNSFLKLPYIQKHKHLWYSLFVYNIFVARYHFYWKKQELCELLMLNHLQRDWEQRYWEWMEHIKKHRVSIIQDRTM